MLDLDFVNGRSTVLAGFALALLLLTASPPPAGAAAPKGRGEPPSFKAVMHMRGSDGYLISVATEDHRTVTLTASNDDAAATYTAPGRASRAGIEADFGELGRISVRFTPFDRRDLSIPPRRCHTIRGHFDGVIRFLGEQEYTRAQTKTARGTVGSGRAPCVPPRHNARPSDLDLLAKAADRGVAFASFAAVARVGGRTVSFFDAEINEINPTGTVVPYSADARAAIEESRGRIAIERVAAVSLEQTAVTSPSPPGQLPVTATVHAPDPFQGTGSFLAVPGGEPTWTGDLSVPLPGAGLVPLTGPEFDAKLCAGRLSRAIEACLDDLEDFVR